MLNSRIKSAEFTVWPLYWPQLILMSVDIEKDQVQQNSGEDHEDWLKSWVIASGNPLTVLNASQNGS